MQIVPLIFFYLSITNVFCFRYSLPGDKNWPTNSDFEELKKLIPGVVTLKGEKNYSPNTWNRITYTPKPIAIVKPLKAQDIIEALKFARKFNIRISVQSTGYHQDHRNIYDNSILIDMSSMNQKSIDLDKRTLTVGPGNNFKQIHTFVADKSDKKLIALSGADPGVGIYGWTAGGGHGYLTKQYGLGVDSVLSIELVLANYSVVTVSETQNQELFRAIRGSGGGSYGIATSLTIKLYDSPGVLSVFEGSYELNNKTAEMYANWVINAPQRVVGYFFPTNFGSNNKYVTISATCFGDSVYCSPYLTSLKSNCYPVANSPITCEPKYEAYKSFYDFFDTKSTEKNGIAYLSSTALGASNIVDGLKEIVTYIAAHDITLCYGNSVLGGISATLDQNQDKTSVALEMRQSLIAISCASAFEETSGISFKKAQVLVMDNLAETIMKKYSKWVYWNEPQHNFPKDDWKERYWGGLDNYNRLLKVKREYDPDGIFSCYHCIGYERFDDEDPSICPAACSCSNTPNGVCAYYDKEKNNGLAKNHFKLFDRQFLVITIFYLILIKFL